MYEKPIGEDENYSGLELISLDKELRPIIGPNSIEVPFMKTYIEDKKEISQKNKLDSSNNQNQDSLDSIRSYKGYFWFNTPFAIQGMAESFMMNINKFIASILLNN